MDFTPQLRNEYRQRFKTAEVRETQGPRRQRRRQPRGQEDPLRAVGTPLDIPWWFVAVIHDLEASRNFNAHLHNGDPLTHRTVHVPKNRPPGNPPFTFEESARDALTLDGLAHK